MYRLATPISSAVESQRFVDRNEENKEKTTRERKKVLSQNMTQSNGLHGCSAFVTKLSRQSAWAGIMIEHSRIE